MLGPPPSPLACWGAGIIQAPLPSRGWTAFLALLSGEGQGHSTFLRSAPAPQGMERLAFREPLSSPRLTACSGRPILEGTVRTKSS